MIATPATRKPRIGDHVKVIRLYRPDPPVYGQITRIENIGGDWLFWLRCPLAGSTIVIPRSKIARMTRDPKPIHPPVEA